jgi:phage terminase small subunit
MALTPKQEAFALAYVETGNASEAYRRAYNAGNMKPETVNRRAKESLKHGPIAARIKELQAATFERHEITVDDILRELEEARTMAATLERPQVSAMVAASMGKAKILGFEVNRTEVTGKDGAPIDHSLRVTFE